VNKRGIIGHYEEKRLNLLAIARRGEDYCGGNVVKSFPGRPIVASDAADRRGRVQKSGGSLLTENSVDFSDQGAGIDRLSDVVYERARQSR